MTRNRNFKLRVLSGFVLCIALLTVLAALAQQAGTGQSATPTYVATPPDASASAQALNPPLPGAGARRFAMTRPQTKLHNARPMDSNPPSFLPAAAYGSGGSDPYSIVVADVNLDGKPDLVVANYCGVGCVGNGLVSVLLGNGDGTFQPAVVYDSGGKYTYSVAVADVNGDGTPDLVVANFGSNTVGVLLGNGDGTFRRAVTYPSSAAGSGATCPDAVAVADVNSDGKPDIVVTNYCGENYLTKQVAVLLGRGDGTFRPAADYNSGGEIPYSVVVADVNGDGKPDLLVANWSVSFQDAGKGSVGVLLGNGDGTFQPAVAYDSGGTLAYSIAVADVNDDGKPDIAVANCAPTNSYACPNWSGGSGGRGVVGILLGNGDGTFQPVVTYDSGGLYATSVAIADVNADGKPDLLVTDWCATANCGAGAVAVLLGNGDGTFQLVVTFGSGGGAAWSVAVANVNHDGMPDLLVANNFSNSVGVLLNNSGPLGPTTTTLTSSLNPSLVGQAVTFTATVSSTAGAPPNGEPITFNNGSAVLGTAPLSAGVAFLTTSSLAAGTHIITASYPGDANFGSSTSPGLRQVVNSTTKSATATTLISSLNPSIYGQGVTLTATVTTSGSVVPTGKVTFTWGDSIGTATLNANGVATLTKSNLNADAYPLTAVYAGDANNLGSTSAVLNQVVTETTSSATINSSQNPSTQGQAVTFTATISSPTVTPTGPVTFTAGKTVLGTAQLSGGKAKFTISTLPVGSTTVTGTYDGDSNIAKSSASVKQTVQ